MDLIDTKNLAEKIFQKWWLLIVFGFFGGIIAYIIALFFFPPVYTAESEMSIVINFKEVGHLTQYEQDQVIGNVVSLFSTPEIIETTLTQISDQHFSTTNFPENCFIERQVNSIFFRCESTDPSLAMNWSNIWANASHAALVNAYSHAQTYESLIKKQNAYENCIELADFVFPTYADCAEIFGDSNLFEELSERIDQEFSLSKNIFTGIKYSDVIDAELPQDPIRYQTNTIMLSGSFFGILFSILFILFKKNDK